MFQNVLSVVGRSSVGRGKVSNCCHTRGRSWEAVVISISECALYAMERRSASRGVIKFVFSFYDMDERAAINPGWDLLRLAYGRCRGRCPPTHIHLDGQIAMSSLVSLLVEIDAIYASTRFGKAKWSLYLCQAVYSIVVSPSAYSSPALLLDDVVGHPLGAT